MLTQIGSSASHSNIENARILNRARLIAINGQVLLIFFAYYYLQIRLPVLWLASFIAVEIAFQLYAVWRVKGAIRISSQEILVHILVDSLILTALVYFSGGANNPFIYLLLLLVALATLMLSARELLLVATIELVLYSLLNIYQRPLELGASSPLESFHLHLAGMWINFVLTVILIAVFGWLTRQSMLAKEKKIQSLRESQLKDEQILALGIMSASAAHELGTPLSTMAIVVDDLKHETLPEDVTRDLELLTAQIAICRGIIKSLGVKSRDAQNSLQSKSETQIIQSDSLKGRLQKVIDNWLVYRPEIYFEQSWHESIEELKESLPVSIEQAITNLLDNAADASVANKQTQVAMFCYREQQKLIIEIRDHGKGITPEISQSIGTRLQETRKKDGLGWGLFLTNASIERVGGNVQLLESDDGGTLTRVNLPLGGRQ